MGVARIRMGELIEAHSKERGVRGLAPKTCEQDEYGYKLLRATGREWPDELEPGDAYRGLVGLPHKTEWKPRTRNICIIRAKSTLSWAVKRQHLGTNPWESIDLFEEDDPDRRPLTAEEVEAILAGSDPHWRTIWQTYIETLCRRDELRLRVWGDFDAEAGVLKLPGRRQRKGRRVGTKTGQARECILGPKLLQRLCAVREVADGRDDDPIFPSRMIHLKTADPTQFLSPGTPRQMLLRTCTKLGIDTTGVDIHSLRYTGATFLAELGVELNTIERMLGHGVLGKQHSLALRIYVKRRDNAVKTAVARIDKLLFG